MKILMVLCFFIVLQDETYLYNKGSSNLEKSCVIFREDFEKASVEEVLQHWDDSKNSRGMSFSSDVPKGSYGKKSLMMTYVAGSNEGGHLFKSFPLGHEVLYARFYVKFLTAKSHIHHLVKLGGYQPSVPYPMGLAGLKPNGQDFLMSGIEFPDNKNWDWGFYTYWMHMAGSPKNYWGNIFFPNTEKKAPIGEWICVEFMIKLNNPVDSFNGEQAFWINGEKVLHLGGGFPQTYQSGGYYKESSAGTPFKGYQWRNTEKLKLTLFWLNYYMTKGVEGEVDQILFDEVLVSNEYIGPLK